MNEATFLQTEALYLNLEQRSGFSNRSQVCCVLTFGVLSIVIGSSLFGALILKFKRQTSIRRAFCSPRVSSEHATLRAAVGNLTETAEVFLNKTAGMRVWDLNVSQELDSEIFVLQKCILLCILLKSQKKQTFQHILRVL